jgi:Ca2+-binding EF-hand superfamily protein
LTQASISSEEIIRSGLEERDIIMLKEAFDRLDEANQGSLPLSKLINLASPYNSDGKPVSERVKCMRLYRQ